MGTNILGEGGYSIVYDGKWKKRPKMITEDYYFDGDVTCSNESQSAHVRELITRAIACGDEFASLLENPIVDSDTRSLQFVTKDRKGYFSFFYSFF